MWWELEGSPGGSARRINWLSDKEWSDKEIDYQVEPAPCTAPSEVVCNNARRHPGNCFYQTQVRSLFTLVTHSLTNWLTDCCLVNLIDVTLACEDANSKLVEAVSVADVDAEDHVGNSLLQICGLRFDHKAKFWDFELKSGNILKLELVIILPLIFCRILLNLGRNTEARFWSIFWILSLV